MNPMNDLDRELQAWLARGPGRLPDRVVDDIVRQLDDTHQRRAIFGNRTFLSVGAGAVAVVALVLALLIGPPGERGRPTTSASHAASSEPIDVDAVSGELQAGLTYRVTTSGSSLTFSVPAAGWETRREFPRLPMLLDVHGQGRPPDGARVLFWGPVLSVYADGCQWTGTALTPAADPTAADIVDALRSLSDREVSEPQAVDIGGSVGWRLQVTAPSDIDFAQCHAGEFRTFRDQMGALDHVAPGDTLDVWIVDRASEPFVVAIVRFPSTSEQAVSQAEQIVNSIRFD